MGGGGGGGILAFVVVGGGGGGVKPARTLTRSLLAHAIIIAADVLEAQILLHSGKPKNHIVKSGGALPPQPEKEGGFSTPCPPSISAPGVSSSFARITQCV